MSPSLDSRENRECAREIKFLVTPCVAAQIHNWARAQLSPDPNANGAGDSYRISSLYFDTDQFDVFHRNGSYGRSKLRIRRYGEDEVVFLERKLRTRGVLAKRRTLTEFGDLERLTADEAQPGWAGYWFHRRLLARGLKPVCQISYRRTARVAMTAYGPIRLTLDDDLRAVSTRGMVFSDQDGPALLEHHVILEMKYRYGLPALFKYLLEEFALIPRAFSKYRLAVAAMDLVNLPKTDICERLVLQYA